MGATTARARGSARTLPYRHAPLLDMDLCEPDDAFAAVLVDRVQRGGMLDMGGIYEPMRDLPWDMPPLRPDPEPLYAKLAREAALEEETAPKPPRSQPRTPVHRPSVVRPQWALPLRNPEPQPEPKQSREYLANEQRLDEQRACDLRKNYWQLCQMVNSIKFFHGYIPTDGASSRLMAWEAWGNLLRFGIVL